MAPGGAECSGQGDHEPMAVEYKCVGAPERPKKKRGAKSRSDRVAAVMQEVIDAEAVDGWEYLRTDLVPVEEKTGWFSRAHEVHRAVLIFKRGDNVPVVPIQPRTQPMAAPQAPTYAEPDPSAPSMSQPIIGRESDRDRFRMAREQNEPQVPQTDRPPSGLG
jgi:hypothetical protein